MSANRLWSVMVNYLSASPHHHESANKRSSGRKAAVAGEVQGPLKQKSAFSRFIQNPGEVYTSDPT